MSKSFTEIDGIEIPYDELVEGEVYYIARFAHCAIFMGYITGETYDEKELGRFNSLTVTEDIKYERATVFKLGNLDMHTFYVSRQ